jgi:hypothetical protein
MMLTCRQCGAPADVAHTWTMTGVGFAPNTELIADMARVQCAAGHWYDEVLDSVEIAI